MTTEAGYIIDQPNMQKELETLQRRWNDVLTASEERSHRVDKMQGAWVAYNQEVNNIEEVLEKFDNRLAAEPNMNSTDPQVLEHELALCKVRKNTMQGTILILNIQTPYTPYHANLNLISPCQSRLLSSVLTSAYYTPGKKYIGGI